MNKPIDPIEAAYLLSQHANRLEVAVLKVRTGWPFLSTRTADGLLYDMRQPGRTWFQKAMAGQ